MALTTFHNTPGQSFAFYNTKQESNLQSIPCNGIALPIELFANLPRSAAPVASCLVRHKIQHSYCLLPCGLLNDSSSLPLTVQLLTCYIAFLRKQSDSVTTCWSSAFNSLVCCSSATTASWNSTIVSVPILSDYNTVLLPTAFLQTGVAFAFGSESTLTQACLDGPLLAQVYRKPCFGTVACLTLMDAKPPIYSFCYF